MDTNTSLSSLRHRLQEGETSSREIVAAYLKRIDASNPDLNALIHVDSEGSLAQADLVDQSLVADPKPDNKPLLGMPIAIKGNIADKGQPLTCASKMLENFVSPYDATVVSKLKKAGAIIIGRANLDEFAMGSSTENSSSNLTRNPWSRDHIPGGSSGGSAAAVTAGFCASALGSDTGGSIRQPASFCGCVGLKPSYGRVSRYGLTAFASSLDQIGPLSREVRDTAIMLNVVAGHDGYDSTSVPQDTEDFTQSLGEDIKGLKIGLPKEYFVEGLAPEVKSAVEKAVSRYEKLGAEIEEVSLPHTEYAIATYYIICTAEASANLARFDGIRYGARVDGKDPVELYSKTRGAGFGSEVKRRIILGTYVLSSGYYDAYYIRAQKTRTLIRQDFQKTFEKVDLLLTPTVPTPAFKIGEKSADPLQMYLTDIFTISANLVGNCGVSLPCGFTENPKLPIGLQLMGKPFEESTLLKAAYAYEQSTDWSSVMPS
ncbi:MAG: Asp-tRNA(Asn)/Glu-tRNA(Gln) amidotransferase subunit GatA [Verrucomicrobia bacterium]|jgi:aspartyl-tRNA(Asn)/glutamyl-tRNA(Gln) amidotransferase subunit A|nr:Asp-tRNA(Asn)/Glu-tRNA(Gln) amidotransferase subunit GatA [Verrucomicrobiota bacterium]